MLPVEEINLDSFGFCLGHYHAWVEGGGNFTHTGLKNTPTPTTYYYRVVDI